MKTKFLLAFLLISLTAAGAPKIKTQHFEVKDSIRLFEKEDPQGIGYKSVKSVVVDWPVLVNGKKSRQLNDFLVEKVFLASQNKKSFPTIPGDIEGLKKCVRYMVDSELRGSEMVSDYIVKEPSTPGVPDVDAEEYPMNRWYESCELKHSHDVGDLVFFVENLEMYLGGAHGDYAANFYAFDVALNKPIHLADIVTSPRKLLRLLPRYDNRDKDNKWWDNVDVKSIENFFVKDGKMVFVFSPYAIGPFCDGIVEVPVPLKTLKAKGLLTAYGKKLMK